MEKARRLENISVACPVSSHLRVPGDGGDVSDIGKSEDKADKRANTGLPCLRFLKGWLT